MLKNYFRVAISNMWKNKIYLFINVTGLAISIAFCMTVYLVYAYNWEFDKYYPHTENIFRIQELKQNTDLGLSRYDFAPMVMGPRIVQEVTGVQSQARYILVRDENVAYQDQVFNEDIGYVDDNFFEFFKIGLSKGTWRSLRDKSSIYLTKDMARKYFGDEDPMGKTVTVYFSPSRSSDFTVVGVFNRIPVNSTFQFGALANIESCLWGHEVKTDDWTAWQQPTVFLKLTDPGISGRVSREINKYVKLQNEAREEWKVDRFELISFKDSKILIGSVTNASYGNLRVSKDYIIVFLCMAILIFLIACFNLANTTMALMGHRVKEVGVRKVMGGSATQVFIQFMLEMSWTSLLALLLGYAIFESTYSAFFSLWHVKLFIEDMNTMRLFIAFVVIFIFTAVLAGIYPALYSNRFQPAAIFQKRVKFRRTGIAAELLNAGQFALSIMVLVSGAVFLRNAKYIQSLDLGYQKENIINLNTGNQAEFNLMRDKIKNDPDILDWSATRDPLGESQNTFVILDTGSLEVPFCRAGADYLKMMKIHLIQGRLFNKDLASDLSDAVIVNQAYTDRFQMKDPIGKMVNLKEGKRYIIGVTRNMISSVFRGHETIPEIYLPASEEESMNLVVKTTAEKKAKVYTDLSNSWKERIPYRIFPGLFQDDLALGNAVATADNFKTIFMYLGIVGALLSLTGIFALSTLNVTGRIKEIGIRKVLGARVGAVLLLMNRPFMVMLGFSVVAGMIFSYFLATGLLSEIYEYHTPVQISILLFSGLLIASLALITTSLTIYKAANTSPTKILRYE